MKFFSRKQEVPALSSAEAEIISIVETAKEMVSLGMLLQTMIQGIALDPLGMPLPFFFYCIAELAIKPCRSSRSNMRGEFEIP